MKPAPKAYLVNLQPLAVGGTYEQGALADWLESAIVRVYGAGSAQVAGAMRFFRRLTQGGGISRRQACLDDYSTTDAARWTLYTDKGDAAWYEPSLERRMALYQQVAERVANAAYHDTEVPPPAIVNVTCTGYQAPSAVQMLVGRRHWGDRCELLNLAHMGCYAAIPAMRHAGRLARELGACSVLHTELCSLHLDLASLTPEQLVVHHLFADGAIRYDLNRSRGDAPGFALLDTFELLIPDTAAEMSWTLGSSGFRMTLARSVPQRVVEALPGVVNRALSRHGLYRQDVRRWAVHPGGTRIIEGVSKCLEIKEASATSHSSTVLDQRGNMSSATLPHIWHAMLADDSVRPGEVIVSLAFGPGLTIAGNILRKEA